MNKERARCLIRLGLMTEARGATLPDRDTKFMVAEDIVEVLRAKPDTGSNFLEFPELYFVRA
ncbi:MAG: hypothetical protein HC780_23045 [Leptolyngbyaceae cyanobacterium CSU_1_3]|nr:hypothetical protein [Leptolyngbyaceae cyanobacterium CSU_1_3]